MNLRTELETRISKALAAVGAPEGSPAVIMPSARSEFGDYQANGAMAAAKTLKTKPRDLAQRVLEQLQPGGAGDLSAFADSIDIAGPGFINIRLKNELLANQLTAVAADDRLGVPPPASPQTVVVDYSAPNLAKEMHVGHLRSTIIGDALARTLEYLGHKVIRQNHVGDWGTQFGMLLAFMDRRAASEAQADLRLGDLEEFYRQAKALFDAEPSFADEARQYVVALQGGDARILNSWSMFLTKSLAHCEEIYTRLGVSLTRSDVRGESAYNDDLPRVVADLQAGGLLQESQGAQCVFLPEFTGKDGQPLPLIVQKSDEGYLYATTDLAAIRYRVNVLKAARVLYVTDSGQSLHFRQVFAVARKATFAPPSVSLEHVPFGVMLGEGGQRFRTRAGGTVKLMDLLEEAVVRAREMVDGKNADDVAKGRAEPLSDDAKASIADAVGIGAVKYADLSQNRMTDYVFSFDKMLSLEGNTAPYMQYAYARIRSIFRKLDATGQSADAENAARSATISLGEPAERALALKLLQFPEAVQAVAADCLPNVLCGYLYDLAGAFTTFYESCPVLKSDEPVRSSRLALCDLVARTIRTGLGLLGIRVIEQM